ncbi:MAG: FHA domain-containing protein [Planctomycetota bacterium]|nr:MAG: FHA domain-containing protein [Planctomycetota bacterium]
MAKLVCQTGSDAGHEYRLSKDKVLFGRQRSCDVQIKDSMASREHFLVRRDGSLYTLVDLGSRNGTHLNDRKVSERHLEFGDVVRVGSAEFLFVKEDGDVDIKDLLTSKYTILEKIGEGGMGIVYKAVQKSMERTVALKVLAPKFSARPRFVEQFIREARAAGALNHPNIIQVHDVASENGIHYFSMEFISGPTSMNMLSSQGPLPSLVALEIIRQTAKALAYAHDHRIIHRDIKPDNIMVTSNLTVKLADLGISKTFDEAEDGSDKRRIVGTPHYMAPEATLGQRIDHRVDIYSLGATAYHLLSARTPFHGGSASEILKAHVKEDPRPLGDIVPNLDPAVAEYITRLMAKDPEQRPNSAEGIALDIQNLIDALQPTNASDHSNKEETVMLRRMVSATASASHGHTETQPGGSSKGATQWQGDAANEDDDGMAGRKAAITNAGIVGGIGLVAVVLFLVVRGLLAGGDAHNEEPEHSEDPIVEEHREQADRQAAELAHELEEERALSRNLQRISDELANAQSTRELAALVESLRLLRRETEQAAVIERIERMEATASSRIQATLVQEERNRFSRLEDDVRELIEAGDFNTARSRLQAFTPEHSPGLEDRIERLNERIERDQERFIANLDRRRQRAVLQRDTAALRELRDSIPASLLEHEISEQIQGDIRGLEADALRTQQTIINEGHQLLLTMNLSELQTMTESHLERSDNETFREQLNALLSLSHDLQAVIKRLSAGLQAQRHRQPPRYRGTIRGLTNPDLYDMTANGVLISIPDGGQMIVPWRNIEPSTLPEVIATAMTATPEDLDPDAPDAETVQNTVQAWLDAVAEVR